MTTHRFSLVPDNNRCVSITGLSPYVPNSAGRALGQCPCEARRFTKLFAMVDLVGVDYFTFLVKIHPDCPFSSGLSPYLFVLKTKKSKLWDAVTRLNGVQSRSSFIRCSCRGNGENHTITWIVSVPRFGDFQRLSKSARFLIPWWGETSATINPNRTVSVQWAQVIKVSPLGRLWG